MDSWQDLLSFLQKEHAQAEAKGYPATLKRLIYVTYESAKICGTLISYLQDPEHSANKVCPQCGKEFFHSSAWVKTCSKVCHKKWINSPQYIDGTSLHSTVFLMDKVDQEKVKP